MDLVIPYVSKGQIQNFLLEITVETGRAMVGWDQILYHKEECTKAHVIPVCCSLTSFQMMHMYTYLCLYTFKYKFTLNKICILFIYK
jgi:hypothetical protein